MADTSNPIVTGDRVSYQEMKNDVALRMRQDYKALEKLVEDQKRVYAEILPLPRYEVRPQELADLLLSQTPKISRKDEFLDGLTVSKETVAPSKYHIPGVNQSGPSVSVVRTFPYQKRNRTMLSELLTWVPGASREIERLRYGGGTKEGFGARLRKYASVRTKNSRTVASSWGFTVREILEQRLPIDTSEIPNWNQDLDVFLSTVVMNKHSSAGPPFYKPKVDVLAQTQELLKDIVQAASQGDSAFLASEYEVIVAECKNKTDRYKVAELETKTRPYFNFCAALTILYSALSQPFTSALELFYSRKDSFNAYGFSWAHGGAQTLYNWMKATREGKPRAAIYGDDIKIAFRQGGRLFHSNPDISSMDAHVDKALIEEVIDYIHDAFEKKWGPSPFWRSVCELWKYQASSSDCFIAGRATYDLGDRLRTGIPGTTLFDTAKSALAVHLIFHKGVDLRDEEKVKAALLETGLQVKDGTGEVEEIMDIEAPGLVICEKKWLGAQLHSVQGQNDLEVIPALPQDDLVALMGNLRLPPGLKDGGIPAGRYLFDCARGYLLTGAALYEETRNVCNSLINAADPLVVTMRVQAGDGRGEPPPESFMLTNDPDSGIFRWPSSDCFPNQEACVSLFLTKSNKLEGSAYLRIFPDLKEELINFKKSIVYIDPVKESDSWVAMAANQQLTERVEQAILPDTPAPLQDPPPLGKLKLPKGLIKFKHRETIPQKKESVLRLVGEVEGVHYSALDLVLGLGGYFISGVLLDAGWRPQSDGYYLEPKAGSPPQLPNIKSFTYEHRRGILEWFEERGTVTDLESSSSAPDAVTAAGIPAIGMKLHRENLPLGGRMPRTLTNPISDVTGYYSSLGILMEVKTKVLTPSPNPRVEVFVMRRDTGKVAAQAINTNAKKAKEEVYDGILEHIRTSPPNSSNAPIPESTTTSDDKRQENQQERADNSAHRTREGPQWTRARKETRQEARKEEERETEGSTDGSDSGDDDDSEAGAVHPREGDSRGQQGDDSVAPPKPEVSPVGKQVRDQLQPVSVEQRKSVLPKRGGGDKQGVRGSRVLPDQPSTSNSIPHPLPRRLPIPKQRSQRLDGRQAE